MVDLCERCHGVLDPERQWCDPGLCAGCTEAAERLRLVELAAAKARELARRAHLLAARASILETECAALATGLDGFVALMS